MKSQAKLIIGILAFIIVLVCAVPLYRLLAAKTQPEQPPALSRQDEKTAPDFTVANGEGAQVRLSDFLGTPVVLNFWASWCPPCKGEMPGFEAAYRELGGEVQFIMVDQDEPPARGAAFASGQGYTFPLFFDADGNAARAYGITRIPATWFISREGKIVHSAVGALSESALREGIERIR